jgi:hypothetical protein
MQREGMKQTRKPDALTTDFTREQLEAEIEEVENLLQRAVDVATAAIPQLLAAHRLGPIAAIEPLQAALAGLARLKADVRAHRNTEG